MDLSTSYLGLTLRSPLVVSACAPLSEELDNIKRMEEHGAAAVVLYSLFEEQLRLERNELDHHLTQGTESYPEALTYFPEPAEFHVGPEQYLKHIARAKAAVNIPIIASLNGSTLGGWTEYARQIQQAGADALELNIYYIPTDPAMTGAEVEQMYLDVVHDVKANISIPLAVKVGPYFSSFANMAMRLAKAGADGLVIFNRFYQPDFDLERLEVVPNLTLSSAWELRTPIRWVSILYGKVPVDFAVTRGVHSYEDVLKGVMAGANVTMMASELLRNGVNRIGLIVQEVAQWLEDHEYHSLQQARGSMSQQNVAEPAAFERANYMKVLQSWKFDPTGVLLR